MPITPPKNFTWQNFYAYTAFEEFVDLFLLQRRSYITKSHEKLDVGSAITDVLQRYVEHYDEGESSFDEKALKQFENSDRNTRLFFANLEYLWAMPGEGIGLERKRSYAMRWFDDDEIRKDEIAYFSPRDGHHIAHPGQHYQTNKYYEILAILRICGLIFDDASLISSQDIRERIESLSYEALYKTPSPYRGIKIKGYCGVHAVFLHLSNPDKYEAIISKSHKLRIVSVFAHIIEDLPKDSSLELRLKTIRDRLYNQYGQATDPEWKYRWFFYCDDLRPVWIGETKAGEQNAVSIIDEIGREVCAFDLSEQEGSRMASTGFRIYRSGSLASSVKKNDSYTCQVCGFHFNNQIVHVHHLDPLAERQKPKQTTNKDLITLCPNCHYLAHYFLRKSPKYKDRTTLVNKLSKITKSKTS